MSKKITVKLNRAGVRSLLRSQEMRDICVQYARAAQSRLGDGYEVSDYVGTNRVNASISASIAAVTAEAVRENSETNSILKALGGGTG